MNKKNILIHVCAVVIFIAASFVYFSPAVFDNKQINQSDMSQFQGMNKALADYTKATGKHSEWTPNMFSGMPSYQIEYGKAGNVFQYIMQPLTLGKYQMSAGIFFLLALGFYVFMVCMGANSWLALFAGLIYALGSYNIIIIGVGHITKAWAMAMIAPVLGGMILVMRRKYTAGIIVFTLSLALQLTFNHIQITYYTLITAVILGISYFCFAVKEKELKNFAFSVLALICCAFIALLPSVGHLSVNNEYAKHTMRGGSELTVHPTSDAGNINKNGLDIDYAFKWSYGKGETMTLLIADYKGGGSADTRVSENDSPILKNRADAFKNNTPLQTNPQALQQVANHYFSSSYYGDQPFTAGPVYFGSIVVFLALLGFLILDNKWRWWLLAATLVSCVLAWGSNAATINSWLFNHMPFYSKFRTPSMALVIANVTMCIAAAMGLKTFLESTNQKKKTLSLYISLAVAGGITLIAAVAPSLFSDFSSPKDDVFMQHLGKAFVDALQQDRESMFVHDAMRSFIFIALSGVVLWLYNGNKIKKELIAVVLIGVMAVIDLWGVDRRYLNKSSFSHKSESMIMATNAENNIEQLAEQQNISHFRVYNLSNGISGAFNEANTSYNLPSIGGYSAAKLQRYQDIIDFYLTNTSYRQNDIDDTLLLRTNPARQLFSQYKDVKEFPMPNMGILNMLDTRYIILSPDNFIENTEHCNEAWFVKQIKWADNADKEIKALDNFNPKQTAVINKKFQSLARIPQNVDENATIVLDKNNSDITHLTYKFTSASDQLAVFSEIYYGDSWHAFIDGKQVPHFCVDYILRGLYIPKGNHTVEFKCYSDTLKKGKTVSVIGSVAALVFILGVAAVPFIKKRKTKQEN